MALDSLLPFLKTAPRPKEEPVSEKEVCAAEKEAVLSYRIRAAVYRKIIERYAEAVNQGEEKTVPQLKELVRPGDESVVRLRDAVVESTLGAGKQYVFERDFPIVVQAVFLRVKELHLVHADLPVSYWLSPKEILEIGAADPFDRALLYCSLLVALGCRNAKIRVVELEGGLRHPLVLFSFGERGFVSDVVQDESALQRSGSVEELVGKYLFNNKRVSRGLFEFNDVDYAEFDEKGGQEA